MEFADCFCLDDGERAKPSQSECGSDQIVFPFRIVGKSGKEEAESEDAPRKPNSCVFTHFAGPSVEVATGAPCGKERDNTCHGSEEEAEKFIFTKPRGEGREASGA